MIIIKIMERDMIVTTTSRVTSGSVNLPVKFHFKGDEWDDLVKTAVFIGSGEERDVALITDECAVPADVLAEAGGDLKIGVYGRLANGATVIPTIWGRVQYIYEGTEMSEPSPHDPEPDWTAQVQQAAATALTKATAVEEAAARGDFDGVSPEVTIDSITHGHSVTITDEEHPEGQSFPVLDGASAYEQAVAGGYTGTEAQFNEELASFKELSDETKEAAPFYAEYGVTTKAEIQAAINGKRQIYLHHGNLGGIVAPYTGTFLYADIWGEGTGYGFALTNGNFQYVYELKSEWTYSIYDLTAPAQRAETAAAAAASSKTEAEGSATAAASSATAAAGSASDAATAKTAAETAQEAAEEAAEDAEAYAVGKRGGTDVGSTDPAYHNNAKYYAQQASGSATAASGSATSAASSATAAGNAQTAAETAQGKAEDAQAAAEAVLASIPEDYTDLTEDVTDLKSAVDALENNDYNSLAYVYGGEGRIRHDNGLAVAGADYTYTDYLDISKYKSLRYKRAGTTSASGTTGMAFYNAGKSYVSGQQVALSQSQLGYVADLSEVPVPPDAVYARFSMLKNTDTYGTFEVFGYSEPALQFNKIGNDLPVYKGSIANGVFSDSNYNVYIPVSPRSTYKITADSRTVAYGALRSLTIPPVAGTSADYSQATGWTGARSAPPNTTVEGVLPDDANYLYVYYGTAGVSRLPAELKINGIDILDISGSLTENIAILADKVNKLHPKTEKTIAFFGDSIVAGSGVTGEPDSQIFHQYIHDLYGFTCLNYGYGSSGYIRNFTGTGGLMGQGQPGIGVAITTTTKLENSTVLARLQSIQNPTFDAVVIFAGTNDWRHQDEYPYADFLTALENTFTYYQSNYGSIPLLVMTPIKRRGGDVVAEERPKTMSDYRDAIIDMCKKYAVPYVDTMTYSGLNPDNTSNYNLFYMRDDTGELDIVHANHLAHQRIARVVGEVLNQLVLWNSDIVR